MCKFGYLLTIFDVWQYLTGSKSQENTQNDLELSRQSRKIAPIGLEIFMLLGALFWDCLEDFKVEPVQYMYFQSRAESSRLYSVTIILEDSAAGGLWPYNTTSLARNSGESFLQCMLLQFLWSLSPC
jgi:hypothetical protein